MTQRELLAALGVEFLSEAETFYPTATQNPATGAVLTGDGERGAPGDPVMVTLKWFAPASGPIHCACRLRTEAQGGLYALTVFEVGGLAYVEAGQWAMFTEPDACAFVRACMLEMDARRMPDQDALLTALPVTCWRRSIGASNPRGQFVKQVPHGFPAP